MRSVIPPLLALLGAPGCWRHCEPVDEVTLAALPEHLSESGLYADIADRTVADDIVAFTPNFPLWADGAGKDRWIRLPDGGVIDATDPDRWRFPTGTRLWKAFSVAEVPIETRMIEKIGPGDGDWAAVAYRWEGDDAVATAEGLEDAAGTSHDLPTAEECVACHGGRKSFVLGFSAVQLAGATPWGLAELVAEGRIAPEPPEIAQPADDSAALGYLHANCSHCHNPDRRDAMTACYTPDSDIDFTLPATALGDLQDAPAWQTAEEKLDAGHPERSEILVRMGRRTPKSAFPAGMPPLGTEEVDEDAIGMLEAWIGGM